MGRRASGLIALAVLVAAAGLAAWQIGGHYRFHDVWCFYHGGQAVLLHIDPYDPAAWRALTADQTFVVAGAVVAPPCPGAFAYPYWTAIAFAPLALLPFDSASLIWSILSLGAAALGIVWCWRAAGGDRGGIAFVYGALVIASLPFLRLVTIGQLSGVLVALVGALALALRRERPGWAGAALGGLLLKPQLWAVLAAVLVARGPRRRQLLVAATMVGLAFALPSLLAFPEWPLRWSAETFSHRVEMARALPSIWSLSAQLTGSLAAGAAIVAVVLGLTWVLVRGRAIDTVTLAALALPFSLATAPYVYTYDHLALALTWASTCVLAARSRPAARRLILAALVITASVAPWVVYALTITEESDTPNAVAPLLAALVLAVAIHLAPPKGETID
ncbi:MAG TPA: glycosyltransferase family 87 protein [Candidatus Limnocylindria bacterium]|nr:glycosyltransferase family 87 protein [Candidatus Limnocylindria bacterium]